jgi:integrase
MKNPANSSTASAESTADSTVGSAASTSGSAPVSAAPPQNTSPPTDAPETTEPPEPAGSEVPNQLKQIKTKVTERVKKSEGKPDTIIWDVRVGLALFNVYRTPIGERELFTLSYWLDGKRYRQVFPTLALAIDAAKAKGKQLSKGDIVAVDLSPADRVSAAKVLAKLKPLGLSLELVVSDYVENWMRLGKGRVPISRAVDFYKQRHPIDQKPKMVKEVVDELLALKRSDHLSDRYVQQLEYALKRFTRRFHNCLEAVKGTEVDAWLRELDLGPRSRNNLRSSIQALYNFAIARKYLPKDHDAMDAVPLAKDKGGEIEIFTPGEMAELLAVASPKHLPFLAISAFAGVRHAELERLDWANVNRKAKIIEIKAGTAKTASRRVIPILPNLAAWLKPYWQEAGPICHYAYMADEFGDLARRATSERKKKKADAPDFKWKHNALRHSFISYRVAKIQDVAKVSLEAGNSPQMIFKHYRELVRPADAKAWFAIVPAGKN